VVVPFPIDAIRHAFDGDDEDQRMIETNPRRRTAGSKAFVRLLRDVRNCRACVDTPIGRPLPHTARPVVRASAHAVIAICGQAPGTRVHASGLPFDDPSGARLRDWMGVTPAEFYDEQVIAFLPMGFCFPGNDAKGGDLPPRKECAPLWRDKVLHHLPQLQLMLLVGQHAQRWHLSRRFEGPWRPSLSETVQDWRRLVDGDALPTLIPLPHPSWRNTGWLKANPWFAAELLPDLRARVASARGLKCPTAAGVS
jgi:uracil-DNA glycosylase